ncbi:MAG: hypothetical protein U5K30_01870 [Acidimicrobiales bacterium]|nr:hypothetical protein [Acidimicrobiales bacterium]
MGPGQQGEAMRVGYDEPIRGHASSTEIAWPNDGYRLFDIGHFVGRPRPGSTACGSRNCLFVPRQPAEQVGGFDEAFSMAGGGYANLDLYERLTSSPGVRVVSILGEGSFHQLHGGTTTNRTHPDLERRQRVRSYTDHFAELRGRPFMGPEKPIHYAGSSFHADAGHAVDGRGA